jgi:hypothetical protein
MFAKPDRERPSPHKLSLCILLQIYVTPNDNMDFGKDALDTMASFSSAAIQKLALVISSEIEALDSEAMERPLKGLLQMLRRIRSNSVAELCILE